MKTTDKKRKQKRKTWYVIHTNCDCCSDTYATTSKPGRGTWSSVRCRYCKKMLGIMSWNLLGTVRAVGESAAMQTYYAEQKAKSVLPVTRSKP